MKKKILLLLLALLLALSVTACGTTGGGNEEGGSDEGSGSTEEEGGGSEVKGPEIIYSQNTVPRIVYGEGTPIELAEKLGEAFKAKTGKTPLVREDSTTATRHEVVIGDTTRPISVSAKEYLLANMPETAPNGCFYIYSEGDTIAIVANHELVLESAVDYFISRYIRGSSLELSDPLVALVSPSEFNEDYVWANRFEVYKGTISDGAIAELAKLYGLFDDNFVAWLAGLYAPFNCVCGECDYESGELACGGGGFYYANSARDTYGFLPDVESTSQALGILTGYGLLAAHNNSLKEAFPVEMQNAIVKFVQSLQSSTDKFFYHPQWGTSINSSRRGRDLDSSIGILNRFGAKPLYGSPYDSTTASAITRPLSSDVTLASAAVFASTLPDYLQSEAAFTAWLEALDINNKSYSAGHTISSIRNQIKSAGLADFCIEWLNSKQCDNGLWESGDVSYSKTNGLLKISTVYQTFDKPLPKADLGVQAFVDMLYASETVTQITDIYNIWIGLSILLPNIQKFGDADFYIATREALLADAEEIYRCTYAKLTVFRKDDSSFSYFPEKSAPQSQGEDASLGLNEGDVNASALAIATATQAVSVLGLTKINVFHSSSFDVFMDVINSYEYNEKLLPENTVIDFNDVTEDDLPDYFTHKTQLQDGGQKGTVSIKERTENPTNKYIELTSGLKSGDSLVFTIPDLGTTTCFYLDADIRLSGGGSQIFLGKSVMINITGSGDNVALNELNARTGSTISNKVATVKANEWFRLRIEHFPELAKTKYYINGECVYESNCFLGYDGTDASKPSTSFTGLEFYVTLSASATIALDNVLYDRSEIKYTPKGEEDYLFGNGHYFRIHGGDTFDGTTLPSGYWEANTTLNGSETTASDGYAKVSEKDGNSVFEFGKISSATKERHVGIPASGSGDYYVFETDFFFEEGCECSDAAEPWVLRISMQKTAGTSAAERRFVAPIFYLNSDGNLTLGKGTDKIITKGEWHNLAIVFEKATGNYEVLLDGELLSTGKSSAVVDGFYGVSVEFRSFASNAKVYLDNTVVAAVKGK